MPGTTAGPIVSTPEANDNDMVSDPLAMIATGVDPPGPMRTRPLILIVEDDGDIAHLIVRMLGVRAYDVLLVALGGDALQHAEHAQPDLITLDLELPDIDGLAVLSQLKANPRTRDIPVIILSIRADLDDPRGALAVASLTKPFDRAALRDAVTAALDGR